MRGFFAAGDNPDLARYCENRPGLPKKLRNIDPTRPDLELRFPRGEQAGESFKEKLQNIQKDHTKNSVEAQESPHF